MTTIEMNSSHLVTPVMRPLGNTGLNVSEIGYGCSSLGGVLDRDGEPEGLRTLQMALDNGINFFDTAHAYSFGRSEQLLGQAVKGCRDKVVIATKGGSRLTPAWNAMANSASILAPFKKILRPYKRYFNLLRHTQKQYDYSPEHMRICLEASLKRLGTDYIDVYQLYNPLPPVLDAGEFIDVLEKFKQEGKIRFYGISCRCIEDALLCIKYPGISTLQIPISLLDHEGMEDIIEKLVARGVGIIAREPLAQGLLTATTGVTMAEQSSRSRSDIRSRQRCAKNFEFLVRPDRTLAQAALQFSLQVPGVSTVIPGMVAPVEFRENMGALLAASLTESELQRIAGSPHSVKQLS